MQININHKSAFILWLFTHSLLLLLLDKFTSEETF